MSEPKEITVAEMVRFLKEVPVYLRMMRRAKWITGLTEEDGKRTLQAIREALTERDKLTKNLSEVKLDVQNPNRLDMGKPKVTRKKIRIVCDDLHYAPSVEELQDCLEENLWAWGITIVDDKETPDE